MVLKGLFSKIISIRNYSIITDNNYKYLNDPKFVSDMAFDFLIQVSEGRNNKILYSI